MKPILELFVQVLKLLLAIYAFRLALMLLGLKFYLPIIDDVFFAINSVLLKISTPVRDLIVRFL